MPGGTNGGLLEREREFERSRALLSRVAGGEGSLLAVSGPAGIGKTRLIGAIIEIAGRQEGFDVLVARGAELEGGFPFGIARQLFEPSVNGTQPEQRNGLLAGAAALAGPVLGHPQSAGPSTDPTFAALHGLYWLTARLATESPTLLVIDDAHWSDPESISWLGYLTHRLGGLPVAVVLGVRPGEPGARANEIDLLLADPAAMVIEPAPLSESAVAELAGAAFGASPDPAFASGCHRATGGNPFLATELIDALAEAGIEPIAANAERAMATGPEAVRRAVLARLSSLPASCRALATALAILERGADLGLLGELAGLDGVSAAEAADLLVAADIIAPSSRPEFRHAILRAAILGDIAPFKRAEGHARAARLLADAGADPARVAIQLTSCEPAGDEWVAQQLRRAAHAALAKGSPGTAADLLGRALAEPPPEGDRGALLTELGVAEALSHREADAIEHLSRAIELTEEPITRAVISRSLATALAVEGRPAEGIAVLERAIDDLPAGARELRLRIEADICCLGYFSHEARGRADRRSPREIELAPGEPGSRPLLAAIAADHLQRRGPVEPGARLALEACERGRLLAEEGPDMPPFYLGANALTAAYELDAALEELSAGVKMASERGSVRGLSLMVAYRSVVHLRMGSVRRAEADARAFLELGDRAVLFGLPPALSSMVWALTELGELRQAEAALAAHPEVEEVSEQPPYDYTYVAFHRGRLRAAQGRHREALDDLRLCGRHERAYGIETPSMTSWRSDAALCLQAIGEEGHEEEATELIADELSRARAFGAPRPLGVALRAAALLRPQGERRLEHLRESVAVLAGSPDRLEHARALTDLGSALRHEQLPAEARPVLDEALATARHCGSRAIAERAHTELGATGIRRRKIVEGGLEALTASELRVAELAAGGRSNRQIAEALFVTTKTVETHLSRAYRKLDIGSRGELGEALSRPA